MVSSQPLLMESRGHLRNQQRCRDGDAGREVGLREVGVIQYNCNKANHLAARPFFEGLDHKAHPIIAIQEPCINPHTRSMRAPSGYISVSAQPTNERVVRTAFLIARSIPTAQWEVVETSGDLQAIRMATERGLNSSSKRLYPWTSEWAERDRFCASRLHPAAAPAGRRRGGDTPRR